MAKSRQVVITVKPGMVNELRLLAKHHGLSSVSLLCRVGVRAALREAGLLADTSDDCVIRDAKPVAFGAPPASDTYVLDYLREHGPTLLTELRHNATVCSDSATKFAIYRLLARGLVARVDGGGPGLRATYDLAPTEEQP